MKNELTELLEERLALMSARNYDITNGERPEAFIVVTASEEKNSDRQESEEAPESVLVDFDYDMEDDTNFNVFMTLKYMWNDWNPLFNDVF